MFMPPPAGGPGAGASSRSPAASSWPTRSAARTPPKLAKVIAGAVAQGIALFTAMVMVAPGIAIAGFVTSSPGTLTGAAPPKPRSRASPTACAAGNIRGENAPDLADALAKTLADASPR
jgi:hypothetical protein